MTNEVSTPRTTCRVCGESSLPLVLSLGNQYLCDFITESEKDNDLPRAPLDLVRCSRCGLLQLGHSFPMDKLYRQYWYRSSINESMKTALGDVVHEALRYVASGSSTWIDIGANDGYLLSRVPPRFTKIGFEPALNLVPLLEEHADTAIPDFFSAERVPTPADVITSCAMFYDLDDPHRFVQDIAEVLSPSGLWVNQLSSTTHMLERNAFDNIVHEHLCYYDVTTLRPLYEAHGLVINGVTYNDVNGGSMRIFASKQGRWATVGLPTVTEDDVLQFCNRVRRWKQLMTEALLDLPSTANGDVWIYGASTKGSTLLQYLSISDKFTAIADRNPAKHGLMMAGTWIPIVDEATMRKAKPSHLLVLPWAFRSEFIRREAALRATGTTMIYPLPSIEFVL